MSGLERLSLQTLWSPSARTETQSADNERLLKNALGASREASLLLVKYSLTTEQAQQTADYCARYADWWDAQVLAFGTIDTITQEAFWRARAGEWLHVAELLEAQNVAVPDYKHSMDTL